MTVGQRWERLAVIKAAIDELSRDVPPLERVGGAVRRDGVEKLAHLIRGVVVEEQRDGRWALRAACDILGIEPEDIRAALRT